MGGSDDGVAFTGLVVFILAGSDTPVSESKVRSEMTAQGARPSSGQLGDVFEKLEAQGLIETVNSTASESVAYRLDELPPLVRYHVADLGPTDADSIQAEKPHMLPNVSRQEIEDALDTLLEQGEIVEVGERQYDVPD